MQPLIIAGVFAVIIIAGILAYISARKRREAMGALAERLGFSFNPNKNWDLARRYHFLDKLRRGSNRYAFNILSGDYQGRNVVLFDYHYQIRSDRSTHHYYFSFFVLHLQMSFPELIIDKEGFFSKVAQAVGYDDIDFESHEFSRRFCVRSHDKKFAYDVCNARMIEYLLANSDLSVEIEGDALAISFNRRLAPEQIEPNLERLIAVRSLMPDYLFSRS